LLIKGRYRNGVCKRFLIDGTGFRALINTDAASVAFPLVDIFRSSGEIYSEFLGSRYGVNAAAGPDFNVWMFHHFFQLLVQDTDAAVYAFFGSLARKPAGMPPQAGCLFKYLDIKSQTCHIQGRRESGYTAANDQNITVDHFGLNFLFALMGIDKESTPKGIDDICQHLNGLLSDFF
jgi:hypothetical protein